MGRRGRRSAAAVERRIDRGQAKRQALAGEGSGPREQETAGSTASQQQQPQLQQRELAGRPVKQELAEQPVKEEASSSEEEKVAVSPAPSPKRPRVEFDDDDF